MCFSTFLSLSPRGGYPDGAGNIQIVLARNRTLARCGCEQHMRRRLRLRASWFSNEITAQDVLDTPVDFGKECRLVTPLYQVNTDLS